MSVFTAVAVLFVIAVVCDAATDESASDASPGQPTGKQGTVNQAVQSEAESAMPKKPYFDLLTFSDNEYNEAFKSLDVNGDETIKIDDITSFYYHADSEFAINKFMELVDTQKSPGSIDLEEFKIFMTKDQVKRQAHKVTILPTTESRQKYYADEILTYVYLVMDRKAIENLFALIESPDSKDEKLDFTEVQQMQMQLMKGNTQYKLSEAETKLVLAEMSGAGSESVSKQAFKEYLLDGQLSFLLRECRKTLTTTGAEYDNVCLIRKLVRFATTTITEYMMTLLFDALDAKDKNKKISYQDIQEVFGCNELNGKHFIRYIGGGKNAELSYGDIRPLLGLPAFKTFMEDGCMKKTDDLEGRVFCLQWQLWTLASKNFFPKFTGVPDLDLIFLFEDLDINGDGTIEQKADLENGKGWPTNLAKKFMDELGPSDNKKNVNLDDFFRFVYEPPMMCAVAECQVAKDNKAKLDCYNDEMRFMITHVLTRKEVDTFFKFYKHNIIYHVTLEQYHLSQPVIENFLTELGQGDHYVTPIEFSYFVKQQEPSLLFSTADNNIPKKHFEPSRLHEKLLFYLERFMTEYDTVILFGKLDVNHDNVIDQKDVAKVGEIDAELVRRMALYGNPEHATYQEFWMFLNSKAPDSNEPRKRALEQGCAQINQELEINCFKRKLKSLQ